MKPKRRTMADKLIEQAIDRCVGRALVGHPIPITSIAKVYDRAWRLAGNGLTEEHMAAQLAVYVESIEVKPVTSGGDQ